jgi:hypothetical protein
MRSLKRLGILVAGAYIALVALEATAWAKAAWLRQAKELGYPAQNCMYCHTVKLPKKQDFKVEELNNRGKWLMTEKDKKKAKEIDLQWLKDYPGGKEQK